MSKKNTKENLSKVANPQRPAGSRQSMNLTEWHKESTKIKEMTAEYADAYSSNKPGTASRIVSMEKNIREEAAKIKDPEILKDSIDTLETLSKNAKKPEDKIYKQTVELVLKILNDELKKHTTIKRVFGSSPDTLAKEAADAKRQKHEGPKVEQSAHSKKGSNP